MESIINYFYNLNPENLKERFGGLLFNVNEDRYLLCEVIQDPEVVIKIYNHLIQNKIGNFMIINNRNNEMISIQEEKKYVLFKIRCIEDDTLTLNESINIRISGNSIWSKIWSERIDYYEIQINELGQNKWIVLNSVNYYIGLAENAIAIANKFESTLTEKDYAIQHYRMNVPIKKGYYFNPNNMLIDIAVRDVAEYIKSSFFNNSREVSLYTNYITSLLLDDKMANLLLARLLYPSYYFDLFDDIILNEKKEEELIEIIREHQKFESFLREVYVKLSIKHNMVYINWLKKETKALH